MNQQDQFNQELLQFQTDNKFPKQDVPLMFHVWAKQALSFVPVAKNNISGAEFKEMVSKTSVSEYTLFEFGIIMSALEGRSARDMEQTIEQYCEMITSLGTLRHIYMSIIQPEAQRIQENL